MWMAALGWKLVFLPASEARWPPLPPAQAGTGQGGNSRLHTGTEQMLMPTLMPALLLHPHVDTDTCYLYRSGSA